jgi:Flp pilus assembly pilin Flp
MKNLKVRNKQGNLVKSESGQGMAEYIIIVILVAIIVLVAIRLFGKSVFNQFENATSEVETLQD